MIGLTYLRQPPVVCGLVRSTSCFLSPIFFISARKRSWVARANDRLDGVGFDSNLHAAIRAAFIRFEETLCPDPLFIDPYAECLVSSEVGNPVKKPQQRSSLSSLHYRLATKFIDDKILDEISRLEELRQIVLLTDGMDTRPYRLNWPRFTVIYDISPEAVFEAAYGKLQGGGAKVSKTCMMIHASLESYDLQTLLQRKGFSGHKPSLWALQGLPLATLAEFEDILSTVSSLAMKGCLFIGELPGCLLGTELDNKLATQRWMEKLFLNHGFRVSVVNYDEVARNVLGGPEGKPINVLFVARQLRLSDAQMEAWRSHVERIDEEGDEEGFEEF
ncbi:uncharacterized protein LOC110104429 isoform X2 [Dendrobium catenatum]|uniref:S-adenosyl-L-methionine-dependent methyltransferase n=1 Tax=Dendrobium catenatum TaxID=906689 RepID=A0A2I0XFS8_9ASPA|nr:uncharacterized protein LOC110104429 isoform X2 [Dendrobium catenatum]PKU86755.1 hypothetical protein MA16_Dca020802 [Dendrobium catenatum]